MIPDDRDSRPLEDEGSRSSAFPDTAEPARRRRIWPLTLLILALLLVVNSFVASCFYIPSVSMQPGLEVGDRILVNKLDREPRRGDVVVFADPGGWVDEPFQPNAFQKALGVIGVLPTRDHLVKRVMGVPGDRIECCDDQGRVLVNGTPVDADAFISRDANRACDGAMRGCEWSAGPVPPGHLFVMGDNRSSTKDSTRWLCVGQATDCQQDAAWVDQSLVVGTVLGVAWPPSHWQRTQHSDELAQIDTARGASAPAR